MQKEIKSKEKEIKSHSNEMETLNTLRKNTTGTIRSKITLNTRNSIEARKHIIEKLRKEILELECKHERIHLIWERIDASLTEVDVPSILAVSESLDLELSKRVRSTSPSLSMAANSTTTNLTTKTSSSVSSHYSVASFGKYLVNKIRTPFKSKKADSSQVLDFKSTGTLKNKTTLTRSKSKSMILNYDWFHGQLPRDDVVKFVKYEGDYLVRETRTKIGKRFVISVKSGEIVKHFLIQQTEESFFKLEGPIFCQISDLTEYYRKENIPLTEKSGVRLIRPILRNRWEIGHEDIELKERIGKGNFGDVYEGVHFKRNEKGMQKIPVAVKRSRMNLSDEQKKKFLQEGEILKQYEHPNIVHFIGICIQKEPIMIIMELVSGLPSYSFLLANVYVAS